MLLVDGKCRYVLVRPGDAVNIFETLGLKNPKELELKAQLGIELCKAIRQIGASQAEVAKRLGIKQPKVSALVNMRLSGFSAEHLATLLTRLGRSVELRVSLAEPANAATVTVVFERPSQAVTARRTHIRVREAWARSVIEFGASDSDIQRDHFQTVGESPEVSRWAPVRHS